MKPHSDACSMPNRIPRLLLAAILLIAGAGCESFQRKFTRKKKTDEATPSPVISFQDYSRTQTPMDLYRKHYLMFEYWNSELQDALESSPVNPKRIRLASEESCLELQALQRLLTDEAGAPLAAAIEERQGMDRQLQDRTLTRPAAQLLKKTIDAHARLVNGQFFWRSVQNRLNPRPAAAAPEAPAAPTETVPAP